VDESALLPIDASIAFSASARLLVKSCIALP
jgi:hypothetical protein